MYLYDEYILTHEPMSRANFNQLSHYMWYKYEIPVKNIHGHTHSDDTGLLAMNYQCVSLEKIGIKPISEQQVYDKFINWR
jgi:calcineurin-like phosphoesterase family protein